MSISVVVGIQTIEDHRERDKMKTIFVIASVLLTLGSIFGTEIFDSQSFYVERFNLRRMSEDNPRQFSNLTSRQKDDFLTLMQVIRDDNCMFIRNFLDQDHSVINVEDKYGQTPLILSLLRGHDNITKCLIEHGADVNQVTQHGAIPLLATKSIDMAEYLRLHGANLDYISEDRDTMLHLAIKSGETHLVDWLIEKGLPVNQKNKFEETALLLAVQITDKNVVKSLIKKRARISEEILKSAAVQCQLAKERCLRLLNSNSAEHEKFLSEELKACREILKILESHFIANQIR